MVAGLYKTEECEIVALCSARGEDNLCGSAVQERGDRLASVLNGGAGLLALLVDRRCIAEVLYEIRAHGFEHLRYERCCRIGVHVYPFHSCRDLLYLFYDLRNRSNRGNRSLQFFDG